MNGEAVVLRIHGIPYVLYGGQGSYAPTPAEIMPTADPMKVLNVIDMASLRDVSIENKMPRYGGVGPAAQVTLKFVDVANHLELLFSRTIDDVTWVRLGASLEAEDDTATIGAATAIPEDFAAAGYGYIGMETFRYTSYEDDVFTLPGSGGRGALDSQVTQHLVDNIPARSFKPVVTAKPVFWQNRGAVLYLHKVVNGVVQETPERELLRGYLDGVPQPIDGGWEATLKSELGKWDRYIGTALETTKLVRGFYYSDGRNACRLALTEVLPHDCIGSVNDDCIVMEEHLVADGSVVVRSVNTLRNAFGVARGHFDGDPSIAPLKMRSHPPEQDPSIVSSYGVADTDTITLSTDNMPQALDANVGDVIQTSYRVYHLPVVNQSDDPPVLEEGLHRWPEAIIELFNSKANVSLTDGATLKFLDCTMTPDGRRITVAVNGYSYNGATPPVLIPRRQPKGSPYLWYPIFRQLDDTIDDNEQAPRPLPEDLAAEGYQVGHHEVLPPAETFWHGGEYMLVADNVFPTPADGESMDFTIKIRGDKEIKLSYDEVVVQEYDGEVIGYRLHITQESIEAWRADGAIPFGVWNNNGELFEPEIFPSGILGGTPQAIASRIMLSGSGTYGYNGIYDNLPRALGISVDPAAVEAIQIASYPVPPLFQGNALKDIRIGSQTVAKDAVRGYLLAMGAALVMRNWEGQQKIVMMPVRATTQRSAGTVRDGVTKDWARRGGRPRSGVPDKLQSTWQFETNYSKDHNKFLRTPLIHDADVIDAMGGAENPAERISLRGLELDSDQPLIFVYQKLRARFGKQTKVYRGKIMWSVARQVDIGDVLTVTTIDGVDENRLPRTITADMLITSISHNFLGKSCEVVLEQISVRYGGIAPAARVTEVIDADNLRFGNDYAYGVGPGYLWFLNYDADADPVYSVPGGGIPILAVHTGAEGSNAPKTITAVDLDEAVLTIVGHGLDVGDRIRGRGYDDSNAWLQGFVHMHKAGENGIGVGVIAPWKYV